MTRTPCMLVIAAMAPHSSLLDAAGAAGREAAVHVFQSNEARRATCFADAEESRQACLREGGEHCDAIHEGRIARCRALYPDPSAQASRSSRAGAWLRPALYAAAGAAVFVLALALYTVAQYGSESGASQA